MKPSDLHSRYLFPLLLISLLNNFEIWSEGGSVWLEHWVTCSEVVRGKHCCWDEGLQAVGAPGSPRPSSRVGGVGEGPLGQGYSLGSHISASSIPTACLSVSTQSHTSLPGHPSSLASAPSTLSPCPLTCFYFSLEHLLLPETTSTHTYTHTQPIAVSPM